ncbi:MAG: hypothetical protein ABF665_19030, partial [Gluconacetobacter sp.]
VGGWAGWGGRRCNCLACGGGPPPPPPPPRTPPPPPPPDRAAVAYWARTAQATRSPAPPIGWVW